MSKLLFNGILVVSFALTSAVFGAANRAAVEAVVGNPFGVARVTVPFPARDVGGVLGSSAYGADEPTGRVLYPAFNQGFLRRLLGTGAPPPASLTVLILFRGQQPFDVTIRTPSPQVVHIVPTPRHAAMRVCYDSGGVTTTWQQTSRRHVATIRRLSKPISLPCWRDA